MAEKLRSVAVLGAGTMGHGIAEVAALAGFDVVLYDVQRSFLEVAIEKIRQSVSKFVEKGDFAPERAREAIGRIRPTLALEDLSDQDLIIEAAPEDLSVKTELFAKVERVTKGSLFASNTSTIPISEIAASTSRPDRFVGLHFFNPPVLIPLVEIIRGTQTSQETVDAVSSFAAKLGKQVVLCNKDVPGFIVNRILGPLLNEAAWVVQRGQASMEGVDSATVYKVGLPMGLFELADYTGIDIIFKAAEAMESREPASIPLAPIFKEKFSQGRLGKKTGEGFYSWSSGLRPSFQREAGEAVDPLLIFSTGINAAAWLVGNEVCTIMDLDTSVKLGLGFPEGILEMADRWGLDKVVAVLREKQKLYGSGYAPDSALEERVKRGEVGISSGRGFYDHAASEMKLQELVIKKVPPVAWLILNRPQRLNAITPRMLDEIEVAGRDVSADDSIRVVVISGEGKKAFSAGADLASFGFGTPSKAFETSRRMHEVFTMFEKMSKPVLAAIDGYALGGGCELSMACDFRLASSSSKIGLTETNLGIMPGAGGTRRLVELVGLSKAREMIYFGRRLSADEALSVGLVDRVFANEMFQSGVEEFAANLAKRAPISLKFAKHAIGLASQVPVDIGQYFEASSFALLLSTQDAAEGIASFLSKKEPKFKGE